MAKSSKAYTKRLTFLLIIFFGLVVSVFLIKYAQDKRSRAMYLATSPISLLEVGSKTSVRGLTWLPIIFQTQDRFETPVKIAQVATYSGQNPVDVRIRNTSASGMELRLEEESFESHSNGETVNYLVVQPGIIYDQTGQVIGEAFNTSTVLGRAFYKKMAESTGLTKYTDPLVFLQVASANITDFPLTARANANLSKINDLYVQYLLQTFGDYRISNDDPVYGVAEEISVLIIEKGVHVLSDGTKILAGKEFMGDPDGSNDFPTWKQITFDASAGFTSVPYIFSRVNSYNEDDRVVTRQKNATTTSFYLGIQDAQVEALITGNGRVHVDEDVAYLAIQPAPAPTPATGGGLKKPGRFYP